MRFMETYYFIILNQSVTMYYKKRVSKFLFYSGMIFLLSILFALMQQDTDDNCSSLLFGSFPRSEVND